MFLKSKLVIQKEIQQNLDFAVLIYRKNYTDTDTEGDLNVEEVPESVFIQQSKGFFCIYKD